MEGDDLVELWAAVARQLEVARRGLPDPGARRLADLYESYLDANELGLAFECLAEVADAQGAQREVWETLLSAGRAMQIEEDDWLHGRALRLVIQHLPT